MTVPLPTEHARSRIGVGLIAGNARLCRDHYRLTIRVPAFPPAEPGQFVQLSPLADDDVEGVGIAPFLPRAFSIGGLRRRLDGSDGGGCDGDGCGQDDCDIDVIHRVVGTGTRWLRSLDVGERINVLGPLGRGFPVSPTKPRAWLVMGGVGFPPLLWLARALKQGGKQTVAFFGARSAESIPLGVDHRPSPCRDAHTPVLCSAEFDEADTPMIVSTDDGSIGFTGTIAAAMQRYHESNPLVVGELAVYTCGPEPMMRAVADYCTARAIECHVCMERQMACGVGTCQSCVVRVRSEPKQHASPADPVRPRGRARNSVAVGADLDKTDEVGDWRYALCCTDGPVFDAKQLAWADPATAKP